MEELKSYIIAWKGENGNHPESFYGTREEAEKYAEENADGREYTIK